MIHRHPGGLPLTKRLIDYCQLKPFAKVVDVGCGEGETVQYLQDEHGLDAVGVDVSEERLKAGKSRSPGLELIKGDGKNLPFAAASMDTVVAECALSVMGDLQGIITEFSRILAPGGRLAITDVYDKNPDNELTHVFLTYPGLTGLLVKNGFKILVWEDHSAHLAEFTACFIMKYGSIQKLWQCIAPGENCSGSAQSIKINKPGYFLLMAEKCPVS